MKIQVINGPNLNMLGKREKEFYGEWSLDDLYARLDDQFTDCDFSFFQSNHEGDIVEEIHRGILEEAFDGLIINPAAFTHTSVAIADALRMVKVPVIEVHISNIYQRDSFRHHSYVSSVAVGQIAGFGMHSYLLAVQALLLD